MNQIPLLCALLLLFTNSRSYADDAVRASAATEPDSVTVGKLDVGLKIRKMAPNFMALVNLTNPKLVWGGRNMLWIEHDAAGMPIFSMNRAYNLQIGNRPLAYYLLESDGYYLDDSDAPDFVYTRTVDLRSSLPGIPPAGLSIRPAGNRLRNPVAAALSRHATSSSSVTAPIIGIF